MEKVQAHVIVSGMVQGVFYRASTRDEARSRGLTGWVRNLSDGRVEAVFEGGREAVESMVDWCRSGPPSASVEDVEVDYSPAAGEFDGFEVRYGY